MVKGVAKVTIKPRTGIQWSDYTMNFWEGCTGVSEGCKECYAALRVSQAGGNFNVLNRASDKMFYSANNYPPGSMMFTCSMSDFFHKDADMWREDAWEVIRNNKHLIWQILTKRPNRIKRCLPPDWGPNGWDHVWLGTTIENQDTLRRATVLSGIPAKVRFISAEPLLGEIDLNQCRHGQAVLNHFQWIILGGESGPNIKGVPKYRPCELDWFTKIINQIQGTDIKIFVKQMGSHLARQMRIPGIHGDIFLKFPSHLRIREFPLPVRDKSYILQNKAILVGQPENNMEGCHE